MAVFSIGASFLSLCIVEPCGSAAARRIPAGCRAKLSVSNPSQSQKEGSGAPKFAGAERRTRWPALRHGLSRLRTGLPAHNADRRAFRRSTGVFLRPRDRLLATDRCAHSNTLDSAG